MARPLQGLSSAQVLVQRVGYGTLALIVLVAVFVLDAVIAEKAATLEGVPGELLRHGSVLPLLFVVVFTSGTIELRRLLHATSARPHALFAHLMVAVLLLTPWLARADWLGSEPDVGVGLRWQVVWLIVTVVGTSVLAVMRRSPPGTFRDVGATFIIVFYLGFLGSFGLHLRCGSVAPEQQGVWLLLIVILATKASDIGGFFVGSTFGRHKLIPKVSPGKSVEGTIGGVVASVLFMMLVASGPSLAEALGLSHETRGIVERITRSFSTEHESGILSPVWRAFFFGLAMALTGQLGDLIESCFKRDAGSKDSGEIIPRFGGILDLVDSPVLAMPAAWFLLAVVWGVAK